MYHLDKTLFDAKSYHHIPSLEEKKVLLRTCLNVVTDNEGNMTDASRYYESFPFIKMLAEQAKMLLITAHLGRPKNKEAQYSFVKIAQQLSSDLGKQVNFVTNLENLKNLSEGVYFLENVRFFEGEESKDSLLREQFARALTQSCDIFVNDAFADYRESVSTYDVAKLLPSYLGPVFVKEVLELDKLSHPQRPFVAVLGGAKLSEKLDSLLALLKLADKVLLGGAMRYTLLKAMGIGVGNSLVEDDKLEVAKNILSQYSEKLVLPDDHMIVKEWKEPEEGEYQFTVDQHIPEGWQAIDIGLQGIKRFVQEIAQAKTIVWNGPMGVFERKVSSQGTYEIGKAIAQNVSAYKLVGGGDSIAALHNLGLSGFDHISTGGGAMLSYLAYDTFPTLDVILHQ